MNIPTQEPKQYNYSLQPYTIKQETEQDLTNRETKRGKKTHSRTEPAVTRPRCRRKSNTHQRALGNMKNQSSPQNLGLPPLSLTEESLQGSIIGLRNPKITEAPASASNTAKRNLCCESLDGELGRKRAWQYGKRRGEPRWRTKTHFDYTTTADFPSLKKHLNARERG